MPVQCPFYPDELTLIDANGTFARSYWETSAERLLAIDAPMQGRHYAGQEETNCHTPTCCLRATVSGLVEVPQCWLGQTNSGDVNGPID